MPNLKDLKNRIESVKNTRKITKAMQMVAAAKLRRAQDAAEASRPYSERFNNVLASLAASVGSSVGRAGGSVKTAVKKAVMPVKPGKNSTMGLAKKFTGQQIARLPKGSVQQQLAARVASSGFKVAQSTPVQFAVQKPVLTGAILSAGQRVKGGVSNRTQRGPEYR